MMTLNDIVRLRLLNQQLTNHSFDDPGRLLTHMGPMQAQVPEMARLALGLRLQGLKNADIDEAIKSVNLMRTHLLRPTWHFVAPADIHWILQLTAPHIKTRLRSRQKQLGITGKNVDQSNILIRDLAIREKSISRYDLIEALQKKFNFSDKQAYVHLIMHAELDAILCNGVITGNRQHYSYLPDKVPENNPYSRDECLALLAKKYFTSHGPATLRDFAWWSGLPITDARKAIDMNSTGFGSAIVQSDVFWFSRTLPTGDSGKNQGLFLPAFDELIVGYTDRSMYFSSPSQHKVISSNGIFRPVILVDGKIAGIWRKSPGNKNIEIRIQLFSSPTQHTKKIIEKASVRFTSFYDKNVTLAWADQQDNAFAPPMK